MAALRQRASLSFYIYHEPKRAKSLHIGVIPRARSTNIGSSEANIPGQPVEKRSAIRCINIHAGKVPVKRCADLGLLLNLVSLPGVADKDTAWKFVQRSVPGASPETDPELDELIGLAVNYARDFVVPTLKRRAPNAMEAAALRDLDAELARMPADATAEDIQTQVFEVGKRHPFESLRGWFQALYETLLGSSQGPRMGSFIALYGVDNTRRLIAEALPNRGLRKLQHASSFRRPNLDEHSSEASAPPAVHTTIGNRRCRQGRASTEAPEPPSGKGT